MLTRWLRLGVVAALSSVSAAAPAIGAEGAQASISTSAGRLRLLTYNIAGLPEGISNSRPSVNLPVIGGLLNAYDLAVVQEDFAYPFALRQQIRLAHGSPPFIRGQRLDFGDGLSQFARLPFVGYERERWHQCHGIFDSYFDCLTPKGFTFARQELADQVFVDVYNLHMDAGSSEGDRRARAAELEQLTHAVLTRSPGHAVIVAGDFNLGSSELGALTLFEHDTGLNDVCRTLGCPEPFRIDRVLVRSSESLLLSPRSWRLDRRFVDAKRRPLSDHLAVSVELDWTAERQKFASDGPRPNSGS